jgi:hypothetical protein
MGEPMPLPNLYGTWLQNRSEILITGPTNDGEIKVKAVSADIMPYWQSGYGKVFESYKFTITFVKQNPNGTIEEMTVPGFVSSDQKELHFNNGVVWKRR